MSDTKNLTVRMGKGEYLRAKTLAASRSVSMNKLMLEGFELLEKLEKEKQLFDDFTLLGTDAADCSVDFAFDAQAEIIGKAE